MSLICWDRLDCPGGFGDGIDDIGERAMDSGYGGGVFHSGCLRGLRYPLNHD